MGVCGGVDAFQRFAGNIHEIGQAGAGADEDGFIALIEKLVDGQGLADDDVGLDLNAQFPEGFHFPGHDGLGKPELRNAVDQHASGSVKRFEDRDAEPLLCQIAGAGQTGGAGADDGHPVSVGSRSLGLFGGMFVMPVRDKAFQPADAYRIHLCPGLQGALAFTLGFLRADPAADRGQGRGAGNDLVGFLEVPLPDFPDEIRNPDIHGAAGDAGAVFTVQAARGLFLSHLQGIAQGYLLKIPGPDLRGLGGHLMLFWINGHLIPPSFPGDYRLPHRHDAQSPRTCGSGSWPHRSPPHIR